VELADAELIAESLHAGEVFATIFDRHCVAVHGYLARRAGRAVADDLLSATFTVAFERRQTFRSEADSALPWLLGIATNLLRERWRHERREEDLVRRLQRERPGASVSESGNAEWLGAALAALDFDQRSVLLLYAWGELAYEEIALALDIPLGTVRSRLHRARGALREVLEATQAQEEERA